jgi:hypothetical protein
MSVEMHLERLTPCKFFPTNFADIFSLIGMSFGVAVAISDARKCFTTNWTLERISKR